MPCVVAPRAYGPGLRHPTQRAKGGSRRLLTAAPYRPPRLDGPGPREAVKDASAGVSQIRGIADGSISRPRAAHCRSAAILSVQAQSAAARQRGSPGLASRDRRRPHFAVLGSAGRRPRHGRSMLNDAPCKPSGAFGPLPRAPVSPDSVGNPRTFFGPERPVPNSLR